MEYKEKVELIERGKDLNILINDLNPNIRAAVAEQSYDLDKLINDKDWHVRYAVAEQGYGLNILINDSNLWIRKTVIKYCKEHIDKEECKKILLLNNI